jgi:hypothetical protein
MKQQLQYIYLKGLCVFIQKNVGFWSSSFLSEKRVWLRILTLVHNSQELSQMVQIILYYCFILIKFDINALKPNLSKLYLIIQFVLSSRCGMYHL